MKLISEVSASSELTDPLNMRISFETDQACQRTWKFLLILDTVFAQQPVQLAEEVTQDAVGVLEISSPLDFLADYPDRMLENIALLEISCNGAVLERFVVSMSKISGTWKKQVFQK